MTDMFKQFQVMAEQEAQATGDLSVEGSAGGVVLDEGQYYGYLFHYVDIGEHEVSFQGESKGFHSQFKVGIALFDWCTASKDFKLAKLHYEPFGIPVFTGARAKFMKMMNCFATKEKRAPHPVGYMGDVKYFSVTKSKDGKYNNVDLTSFTAGIDPRTKEAIELPNIEPEKVVAFLWNNPSVDMFNKLNDYTKREILNAHNYEGSKVQEMIAKAGGAIVMPKEKSEEDKTADEKAEEAVANIQKEEEAKATETVTPATPASIDLSGAPSLMMPTGEDDIPFEMDK